MLDVTVNTRNVELTDWLQSYVDKKIGKMDRYLPVLTEASVELSRESVKSLAQRNVAQVTLRGGRTIIRAEERAGDMTAAIDSVVDVLYRQIVRYKGKKFDRLHSSANVSGEQPPLETAVLAELESELEEEEPEVVRVKQFVLEEMSELEAIEQMEMLGHSFFIFYNANNGRVNVVYRRKDNKYGLLDPQLA